MDDKLVLGEFMALKLRSLDLKKDTIIKRKLVEFFYKIQLAGLNYVQYTVKCILNHKPYLPRGVMLAPVTVKNTLSCVPLALMTGRRLTKALERAKTWPTPLMPSMEITSHCS